MTPTAFADTFSTPFDLGEESLYPRRRHPDFAGDLPIFFTDFAQDGRLDGRPVRGILLTSNEIALDLVGGDSLHFLLPAGEIDGDPRGRTLALEHADYRVADWTVDQAAVASLELEAR